MFRFDNIACRIFRELTEIILKLLGKFWEHEWRETFWKIENLQRNVFHHGLAGVVGGKEAGYCCILTLVRLLIVWCGTLTSQLGKRGQHGSLVKYVWLDGKQCLQSRSKWFTLKLEMGCPETVLYSMTDKDQKGRKFIRLVKGWQGC